MKDIKEIQDFMIYRILGLKLKNEDLYVKKRVWYPVSSIQYPASSIQYPASSIQHPVTLNRPKPER
jgi:hypothetical protein